MFAKLGLCMTLGPCCLIVTFSLKRLNAFLCYKFLTISKLLFMLVLFIFFFFLVVIVIEIAQNERL